MGNTATDLSSVQITYEARRPRNRRLWVVSTQFNPAGYKSLANNYRRFAEHMSCSGVNLVTSELTYPGQYSTLGDGPNVLQLQARDAMWHKERLLNLAIERLPAECDAVAWVDADILFTNDRWVEDTLHALDRAPVVQLFEKVFLLDSQGNHYRDAYGFAFSQANGFMDNYKDRYSGYWNGNMKHPGFAWAGRRDVIAEWGGLYDHHILGGGDFQMALAFMGDRAPEWYGRFGPEFQSHMYAWSQKVYDSTSGKIGYTPGCAMHMWHGHSEDRQYVERSKCLVDHAFDPLHDIRRSESGLWEWSSDKPELHRKVADYFGCRKDDRCFPAFPTRYEDKHPVVIHVEGESRLRSQLAALALQDRRDFVVWVAFADWAQAAKLKHICRDEYWPFEIRLKSSYKRTQRLVPRVYQTVDAVGSDSRARKALFLYGVDSVPADWITTCTHQAAELVLCGGRVACANVSLVRSGAVLREAEDGVERIVRAALAAGLRTVEL